MMAAVSGPGSEKARQLVERLVERRRELELSQEDVAAKMGTRQPVIARLETGGRDPKLATVLDYAAAVKMIVELRPIKRLKR